MSYCDNTKTKEDYTYNRNQPLGYGIVKLTPQGTVIQILDNPEPKNNIVEGYCDPSCPSVRKHDPTEWMGVL